MEYPVESFSEAERRTLRVHFSNLDRPVFALMRLPETVKGALFARYSRYPGTLRRLFLDEFAEDVVAAPADVEVDGELRAAALYERVFVGYGDDSVAQLGGAHVACEYASNVLTKILERPRLGSYLEQSTRYIAYDRRLPNGSYRYYRDAEFGCEYDAAMDFLFESYSQALPRLIEWVARAFPAAPTEPESAHRRAVQAKALDLLRGLLPAASLSHVGIYASGQTYEQLILHLLAHPLPEARAYGRMILEAVQAVMPSFVRRVEQPERGGAWGKYLERREKEGRQYAERLGLAGREAEARPSVRLLRSSGDEEELLAALLFESASVDEGTIADRVRTLSAHERATLLSALAGERANRRHRPGRGLETLRYRFEIVSDYGAFRDLQRHRLLTAQWQRLTPDLGADVPDELDEAGVGDLYRAGLDRSRSAYSRLAAAGFGGAASYAVCLGFRIRYMLDMNAREAMHVIELRSGREGHPSYRAVAHELHRLIATVHPGVAALMIHLDESSEPRLERLLSELRSARRA